MTFSEFAKKIRPIVSGDGVVNFIRTLFDAIIDVEIIENGKEIKIGDSTCKKYYNEGITKVFAAKIKPFLNSRQFSDYILHFSEDTLKELYNAFKDDIEGLTLYNAPDMIAELFKDIIITVAIKNQDSLQVCTVDSTDLLLVEQQKSMINPLPEIINSDGFDVTRYHLIVFSGEVHSVNYITLPNDRVFIEKSNDIQCDWNKYNQNDLDKLLLYPALICQENTKFKGETDEFQYSVVSTIRKIKKINDEVRVYFEPICLVKQVDINLNPFDFGIRAYKGLTPLNRTHWEIKKLNLFEALEDSGIKPCLFDIVYSLGKYNEKLINLASPYKNLRLSNFDIETYTTLYESEQQAIYLEKDMSYLLSTKCLFTLFQEPNNKYVRVSINLSNIEFNDITSFEYWRSPSDIKKFLSSGTVNATVVFKVTTIKPLSVKILMILTEL